MMIRAALRMIIKTQLNQIPTIEPLTRLRLAGEKERFTVQI